MLILIVVCHSSTNNFAILVVLDSAQHIEEEAKAYKSTCALFPPFVPVFIIALSLIINLFIQ